MFVEFIRSKSYLRCCPHGASCLGIGNVDVAKFAQLLGIRTLAFPMPNAPFSVIVRK